MFYSNKTGPELPISPVSSGVTQDLVPALELLQQRGLGTKAAGVVLLSWDATPK